MFLVSEKGIIATFTPRLTAEDAVNSLEAAFDYAVFFYSIVTIPGTRWIKPTKPARVKDL